MGVAHVSQRLGAQSRTATGFAIQQDVQVSRLHLGLGRKAARAHTVDILTRLRIPERLWHLPPATFSGGEQQRINIARNMIKPRPILLLDEPTASLDAANTQTVIDLIREAVGRGAALVGIFHDAHVGAAVATRRVDVAQFRSAA